ncbi:YybH family protein [Actinomadura logoneensis]|uniref:YybH family protein n=1 Tax=Actinomadura logoneensis TaxID=2293572 RepID=UPI001314551B|nr:nuclear transport factor 2 family protein [Actinomadura logoneensis]
MSLIANPDDRASLLDHDQRFFDALVAADTARLDGLLDEEFILVAVNDGAAVTKAQLLGAIDGGLRFPAIESHHADAVVRRVGDAAIVVGRTSMNFSDADGTSFTSGSRYTHVFAADATGGWRLVSAQGTQITPSAQQ